jgi:hypothetical protein
VRGQLRGRVVISSEGPGSVAWNRRKTCRGSSRRRVPLRPCERFRAARSTRLQDRRLTSASASTVDARVRSAPTQPRSQPRGPPSSRAPPRHRLKSRHRSGHAERPTPHLRHLAPPTRRRATPHRERARPPRLANGRARLRPNAGRVAQAFAGKSARRAR